MSGIFPKVYTGMIAATLRPVSIWSRLPSFLSQCFSISSFTIPASIHQVSSISISQGIALQWAAAFADAIKVKVGRITKSPGPTPTAVSAAWSPVVPADVATAKSLPVAFAVICSNLETYSPTEDT